jgi:hypothetical protein
MSMRLQQESGMTAFQALQNSKRSVKRLCAFNPDAKSIFEIETDSIAETQVLATIFNGKVVYDPDGILQEPIGTRSSMPSAGYLTTIGWCPVIPVALSTIIPMLRLS